MEFPAGLFTDVRYESVYSTTISFENGQLKQNKTTLEKGAFIRVFDGKRWYYSATTDLDAVQEEIDALAAMLLSILPEDIAPVLGLYPLFFAMAFQWNSFPGASGFVSSTIFSTNNLRQFTSALSEVWLNHDDSHWPKARFFGLTLLSFHTGVGISYLLWQAVGARSSWFCLLPILAAFWMFRRSNRQSQTA